MYTFVANHLLRPVINIWQGSEVTEYGKQLEESQWWSQEKIFELQNYRIRQLVKHAYDNVPYYNRIFDEKRLKPTDIKTNTDLIKLPVLTKKIINKNFDQLIARGFSQNNMVLNKTGGSTGQPLEFYTTSDERFKWSAAKINRVLRWWGYRIGDKRVQVCMKLPKRSALAKFKLFLLRTKTFESSEKMSVFVRKLDAFKPKYISGYPSFIYLLAKFVESQKTLSFRLKAIVTHSEQLYDFQRNLFEKVFECPTYSNYESFELNHIAGECPEGTGYHISAECVAVEIVDDNDNILSEGKNGRILLTNLFNYAMPFIRYDIGDVGEVSSERCICGRGLPMLKKLNGRSNDYLTTTSGEKIPGVSLKIFASKSVDEFQLIQDELKKLTVKIVLNKGCKKENMNALIDNITDEYKRVLGKEMEINIEFVDKILTTKAGKRRVVISEIAVPNS